MQAQFRDHSHYVQGVAWSPCDTLLLTTSSDRTAKFRRASNRWTLKPASGQTFVAHRRDLPDEKPSEGEVAPPAESVEADAEVESTSLS